MQDQRAGVVVRGQFEAVNRRDWTAAMAAYTDDVVLRVPNGLLSGEYRGRDRVGEWFGDWMRTFRGRIYFDIRDLREAGNDVALWAHHTARGEQSGLELEADFFYQFHVRDGKIAFVAFCETWAEALDTLTGDS